jgi:prephenate dehydrogenase
VTLGSVVVIGTGLIGTSVALSLRARDVPVWLSDSDSESLRLAVSLGAGSSLPDLAAPADLAVIAVPPSAVASVLASAQQRGLARVYTDVASVKRLPVLAASEAGCDMASFVPGLVPRTDLGGVPVLSYVAVGRLGGLRADRLVRGQRGGHRP